MRINNLTQGIFCVMGGFLIHFSLGTIYTFGNMSPYIASYLKYRTQISWITNGHMVWIFTTQVFLQGTFMAFGGVLEQKIGARITCLIFGWVMSLGTMLTYFSLKVNLWMTIFTYGGLYGLGLGMAYAVAISAPLRWFPKRKGMITGIVSAGYGLGSVAFNPTQTRYINPTNISPNATETLEKYFTDSRVLDRVRFCFIIIGTAYASIQLVGSMLLTSPPKKTPKKEITPIIDHVTEEKDSPQETTLIDIPMESKETDDIESKSKQIKPGNIVKDYTFKEAIRDKRLWILCCTFFCNGFAVVSISSLYKSFGQTFIDNDSYFSIVGAAGSFFNSFGRIMWGRLLDKFPYRKMMTGLCISMSCVMGSFYFCSYIDSSIGKQVTYFMWVSLLFLCLAGNFAMFPTIVSQSFGSRNMAQICGLVFFFYGISGIFGAMICSLLLPLIHYGGVFIIATSTSMISIICTQFFPRKYEKTAKTGINTSK